VTDGCGLCNEPIEYGENERDMPFIRADGTAKLTRVHTECILRSVVGGIGHHLDHDYWCKQMHDPDGGRSLRQSAREVAALIREKGIENINHGC
jgi:hypothetical protein